jgi:UDPglucose 6-dehydrogenase
MNNMVKKKSKISVIGLGFVGLSIALTNAKKGFQTIGVDVDNNKIKNLQKGIPSFFEPQIQSLLEDALKKKSIKFTTDLKEALLNSDISFLCVGTPPAQDGKIDLTHIKTASKRIHQILKFKEKHHLLVVKSTVAPQTNQNVIIPIFKDLINMGHVDIVSNPEFLREGHAINDVFEPHLIVIGENNSKSGKLLEEYYRKFYKSLPEIIHTDITSAELIKYANNAFLATKISFINSLANICQELPGTDVNTIANAIGKDPRIGPLFLQAGPGFGGSCLPKDLSALINFSNKFEKTNELFKAILSVNQNQPVKVLKLLNELKVLKKNKTISILGLAFKKDTDDIRAAISIEITKLLLKKGLKIKVYDPMAIDNFRKLFKEKITYCSSIDECLKNSDCCCILTEWNSFQKLKPEKFKKLMKNPNVVDARRILNPKKFESINFRAIGLGN